MGAFSDMFEGAKRYGNAIADTLSRSVKNGAEMYGSASQPAPQEVVDGVLGFTPVVGDALSVRDAYDAAKQGNWGEAALNAAGVLPGVPSLGKALGAVPITGVIKSYGKLPKTATLPSGMSKEMIDRGYIFNQSDAIDTSGNVWNTGRDARINAMKNGDFILRSEPTWPAKGPSYYAVGDDVGELINKAGSIAKNSETGKKNAYSKTLLGSLEKEFGDVFETANSTQSKSQYITHIPSGSKIRISDHNLPLHYVQPDLDLRLSTPKDELISAIRSFIKTE